ncbi:MAG: 50S ribosomal protein L33 [Lentisphaeraceae bacterium]|nr:50S ribosomal protein L33 [Lentisphaeraceae bacterium]
MAKRGARDTITLQCTETGERTYSSTKNKTNTPGRIELKKYNPKVRKHTLYRETR